MLDAFLGSRDYVLVADDAEPVWGEDEVELRDGAEHCVGDGSHTAIMEQGVVSGDGDQVGLRLFGQEAFGKVQLGLL